MKQTPLLCLSLISLLTVISACFTLVYVGTSKPIVGLPTGANTHESTMQGSLIQLNNTDYNSTTAFEQPELGNATENVTQRMIVEYGDYVLQQSVLAPADLPQVFPTRISIEYADASFQIGMQRPETLNQTVSPRIIIEYADYASFASYQPYPGPDPTFLITNVTQNPLATNVTSTDVVSVNATVTDSVSNVTQVSLNYTSNNETWIIVNMTNLQGNIWNSTIPPFPNGTNITYTIKATDSNGNTITTQQMGYRLQYNVVQEFTILPIVFLLLITTPLAVIAYRKKANSVQKALVKLKEEYEENL